MERTGSRLDSAALLPLPPGPAVSGEAPNLLTGPRPPPVPHRPPRLLLHRAAGTHMGKSATACQRGSPVRYEYRSVSQPIWGPWSHVSTHIALLATSPGHIGDRKEVAEQKHSRCSSSAGHRGSLLPQHLARSAQSAGAPPQSGYLTEHTQKN